MDKFEEFKKYLFSIKEQIKLSFFLFMIAIFFGFVFAGTYPVQTTEYIDNVKEVLSDKIDHVTPMQTFFSIFENNVNASFYIVLMGVFFGFFSFTFLTANGFIIGLLANFMFDKGFFAVFWLGIIPHGIIEIPCLILSAAIGFKIGFTVLDKITNIFRKKKKEVDVTGEVARGLEFYILVVIPLLFFAAYIETYTTPLFMSLVS